MLCSGRVDPQFVLGAFARGADGVLIGGCHPGDCHYQQGNLNALRRFELLRLMLRDMGIEDERLRLESISASEGDKVQKVDLCEACSKEKGVSDPTGFSLADLLLGLGASKEMEEATPGVEIKCPNCGFTQADFKKAGRFGCSECYGAFSEALEGLLKTMHKGVRHIGKFPAAHQQ